MSGKWRKQHKTTLEKHVHNSYIKSLVEGKLKRKFYKMHQIFKNLLRKKKSIQRVSLHIPAPTYTHMHNIRHSTPKSDIVVQQCEKNYGINMFLNG